MKYFLPFMYFLLMTLALNFSVWAESVEQKVLNFKLQTERLLKGELHYSFEIISSQGLIKNHPELVDFDSLGLLKRKDASILLNKISYVVQKPVGFFDQQTSLDQNFLAHLMGSQKIQKLSESKFLVTVPGQPAFTYQLHIAFDSDDISTAHTSKIVKSIAALKKLDVLAQSSSSIIYREMTDFTLAARGGISVSSYVPLKENRTLVIAFQLISLQDYVANASELKTNTLKEFAATRNLINSYQIK